MRSELVSLQRLFLFPIVSHHAHEYEFRMQCMSRLYVSVSDVHQSTVSTSRLAGLAVTDKVSEAAKRWELPMCWQAEHLVLSWGTSTLCKHICASIPVPVKAGWRLNYAWMSSISFSEDSTPSPWLFAPVHQPTKNTPLSCFCCTAQSTCLLFTTETYLD